MHPGIAIKLAVVMLIMPSAIVPSSAINETGKLIGTTTTWDIDINVDEIKDGALEMTNVASTTPSPITASGIVCDATFENYTISSHISFSSVPAEWFGIPLIVDDVDPGETDNVGVYLSVSRHYVQRDCIVEGRSMIAEYDTQLGILLGLRAITTAEGETIHYHAMISSSTAFTDGSDMITPMTIVAIIIGAIAVVYLAAVTIRDKNQRKNKACFGPECWSTSG